MRQNLILIGLFLLNTGSAISLFVPTGKQNRTIQMVKAGRNVNPFVLLMLIFRESALLYLCK